MLALARFGANPLTFLDGLRADERDIVPFTLGNLHCHLLKRPEDIEARARRARTGRRSPAGA